VARGSTGEQWAQDKGLSWRAEIPAGLPRIWGDRTRLRQVALNLLSNAFKFTTQGEVALVVSLEGRTVTVSIRDTGLGVPPEEQHIIFDEFRQAERTAERGFGGLGLGLAICRRLVELHGGEIRVESSGLENQGAAFTFTLPALQPQRQIPAAAPGQWVRLVAENLPQAENVRQYLELRGYTVELADWEDMGVISPPPAAILMDEQAAARSGWNVIQALQSRHAKASIPVLFFRLGQSGSIAVWEYLTKPVNQHALAESLRPLENQPIPRVLVVDDEPGILEMHTRLVKKQLPGCEVFAARNGREALSVMQRVTPSLVLLDLMMPELGGFGVIEAMRDDPALREIPVVVLTGQALTEEDLKRLNRGVVNILSKGVYRESETLERLEAALDNSRHLGSEIQRAIRKALVYIHQHYSDALDRSAVAQYVGLSERHLTRCFQQEMGLSWHAYLNRYRMQQTKKLLARGEMSITDVALEVGFADSHYFARVFQQEVGCSPRAYQKSQKSTFLA
jgi:AraC-like DNA-binding protein/anti-sigma regulatory factor (Ser/Thr protein kinase)